MSDAIILLTQKVLKQKFNQELQVIKDYRIVVTKSFRVVACKQAEEHESDRAVVLHCCLSGFTHRKIRFLTSKKKRAFCHAATIQVYIEGKFLKKGLQEQIFNFFLPKKKYKNMHEINR